MADSFSSEPPALGEFLAGRRARVDPGDSGVDVRARRRVTGLRREEVAVRAGVSVDYYTRLEQGRERHPSPQVLDALASALMLEDDARQHLHRLGGTLPISAEATRSNLASPELLRLLDEIGDTPALVLGETLDVLGRNRLCRALYGHFTIIDNSARMVFLDPAARSFYDPWDGAAEATVATLRLAAGRRPHDATLSGLIGELSDASRDFRALWQRLDVRSKTNEIKRFRHPSAGDLTFSYQSFDVRAAPGQQLVLFCNFEGDDSARRLAQSCLSACAPLRR